MSWVCDTLDICSTPVERSCLFSISCFVSIRIVIFLELYLLSVVHWPSEPVTLSLPTQEFQDCCFYHIDHSRPFTLELPIWPYFLFKFLAYFLYHPLAFLSKKDFRFWMLIMLYDYYYSQFLKSVGLLHFPVWCLPANVHPCSSPVIHLFCAYFQSAWQ